PGQAAREERRSAGPARGSSPCTVRARRLLFFFSSRRRHTRSVSAFLLTALPILLGTFVKDWFRYESHFVHGRDSLVDILKERGLLSESDAVQPLIGKKS